MAYQRNRSLGVCILVCLYQEPRGPLNTFLSSSKSFFSKWNDEVVMNNLTVPRKMQLNQRYSLLQPLSCVLLAAIKTALVSHMVSLWHSRAVQIAFFL